MFIALYFEYRFNKNSLLQCNYFCVHAKATPYCIETYVTDGTELANSSDFFSDHPQLLEVDQTINTSVIAQMQECDVFLDDGEPRDLVTKKHILRHLLYLVDQFLMKVLC